MPRLMDVVELEQGQQLSELRQEVDGGVDGEVDGAGCHQLFIQMGENMGKPETCSPQRLRRLLDPPAQPALLLHHQGM